MWIELLGKDGARFLQDYRATLDASLGFSLLLGLLAIGLHVRAARAPRDAGLRLLERAGVGLAVAVAVTMALQRVSLVDDAFISFRYARNFAEGHGLVFNVGERVEGYTNFLWTVLIGIGVWLGGAAEYLGLWGSLACFAFNVLVVHRLSRALHADAPDRVTIPIAALLVALQYTMHSFGTSGLETAFTSLLVNLGVLHLVRLRGPRDAGLAGLWLILATLSRPDHAIFYAVGALGIVLHGFERAGAAGPRGRVQRVRAWLTNRQTWLQTLAYAAPFLLYAAHFAFRLAYYGDPFPNTYYAKSADRPYYSQGLAYAGLFFIGSHFWWLLPQLLLWAVLPSQHARERRFKRFALPAVLLYTFYVIRVGGDFMYGRFFVTLIPLLLLAALRLPQRWLGDTRRVLQLVGGLSMLLACATAAARGAIPPSAMRSRVVDERTFYVMASLFPIVGKQGNFRVGQMLGKLHAAGLHPRIATSGIGMLGYYSRLEVIDIVGLTDAHVARQPLPRRGRPGHEKTAKAPYIRERAPHFVRGKYVPKRFRKHSRLAFGGRLRMNRWFVYRYDRKLMNDIRRVEPRIEFDDFEVYLDRYIERIGPRRPLRVLRRDIEYFRDYYFALSDDPGRLRKLETLLSRRQAQAAQRRVRRRRKDGPASP